MKSDEAEKKRTKMAMARLRCSSGRTRQLHDAANSHVRAMPTISAKDGQISRFQEQRKPAMLDLDITVVGLITALATSQVATARRSGGRAAVDEGGGRERVQRLRERRFFTHIPN